MSDAADETDVFEDAIEWQVPSASSDQPHQMLTVSVGPSTSTAATTKTNNTDDAPVLSSQDVESAAFAAILADKSLQLASPQEASRVLTADLASLQTAVDLYLNSHFKEAEAMLQKRFKSSFYCMPLFINQFNR
jgi:hypothetical protein